MSSVDLASAIPFEPSHPTDPEAASKLKALLVRNLLLAFAGWRRHGMVDELELRLGDRALRVVLEGDQLVVFEGAAEIANVTWDPDAQLYAALGELFALRAQSR